MRTKKDEIALYGPTNTVAAFNTAIFNTEFCDSLVVFVNVGTVNSGTITLELEDVDGLGRAYTTRSAFASTIAADNVYFIAGPLATQARIAVTGTFDIDDLEIRVCRVTDGVK